jgi:dipeptidyl aminopeptidase/acylaminoacyl peptidase
MQVAAGHFQLSLTIIQRDNLERKEHSRIWQFSTSPVEGRRVRGGVTPDSPPEFASARSANGGNSRTTHLPELGKAESIEWTNEGSTFRLVVPPAKSRPTKISDGGPHPWRTVSVTTSNGPRHLECPAIIAALSARLLVLLPNPRGFMAGKGVHQRQREDFAAAICVTPRRGEAAVNINRFCVGVMGWNYGGFAVADPSRRPIVHAAVAGAGIANWQSYYGQNLIDQWMIRSSALRLRGSRYEKVLIRFIRT